MKSLHIALAAPEDKLCTRLIAIDHHGPVRWKAMQVPVELKMKYLQRRTQDIEKLRVLMKQDDFREAAKLGHQVKGNAVTFEFPHMACLGMEIEKAAHQKNHKLLESLLSKMESMISEAKSALH